MKTVAASFRSSLAMFLLTTFSLATFSLALFAGIAHAQASGALPRSLATAKTVAVINDTHVDAVSQGAVDALKAWGRFTVVDDPDNADFTLRFNKSKDHAGHDSQQPDNDGKTSYGYSMSFSTSIHMKAYLKDGDAPFYTTKTDDGKKKAGMSCVSDFRTALQAVR